jgi:intein/homing endonuclease
MAETMMDVGEVPLLEVGDTLVGFDEEVTILSIEDREHIENYTTYNLSIENTHNYIVEGIVAHNAVPGC